LYTQIGRTALIFLAWVMLCYLVLSRCFDLEEHHSLPPLGGLAVAARKNPSQREEGGF
jgi:hypothetical protein